MGTSTDGILAYGYDLGEDWGFEYDEKRPNWMEEADDYIASAEHLLLTAVGVTHELGDYVDDKEMLARTGVFFEMHCSDRAPMYLLVAKSQTANRGYPEAADFTVPEGADERLAWALGVLGIEAPTEKPQWLLASWWG